MGWMSHASPAVSSAPSGARSGSHRLTPPAGSWADDLWAKLTATPELRRRTEWVIVGIITLIAALLRFVALGHPHRLVFDEVYYVLDGWSLSNEGYEAKYPEDGRDLFAAGTVYAYNPDEPSYVVHPPLGKYLIGWGMHLIGPENAFAWRAAVAFFGTLAVPLLYLVARKLLSNVPLAAIAALFLAIDGHAIVTSRISILDGLLMFFVLLGFLFLLYDREHQRRQLLDWVAKWRARQPASTEDAPPEQPGWGPILWNRPWLLAMAIALGLASSIKWSGAYFLAAFCLATIVIDLFARREAGIRLWFSAATLKQGWASFLISVPAAIAVYLASWTGWLATSGGFYRDWVEGEPATRAWTGALEWVPYSIQNLWHYHSEAFRFHSGLASDHPYNSGPLEWPFLLRPTAFSYEYSKAGEPGCMFNECVTAITSLSNPLIFWLGTIGIVFLAMYVFVNPSWRYGLILTGYFAGWVPWLITGRTSVYHFYVIAWLPFMLLAAVVALQTIAGSPRDDRRSRTVVINIVAGFLGACVLVSLWFLPVWTGITIPTWYWHTTHWLPGWK